MDEIAEAAGVGKGTLYRRFGDRAGLAIALIDEAERELQNRVLRGRPPLGPGRAPAVRLRAFLRAYLRLLEENLEVILESGSRGARFRVGSYGFWQAHVALLLREGNIADANGLADLLLGSVEARLYHHLRHERGLSAAAIARGVERLAAGLCPADARP